MYPVHDIHALSGTEYLTYFYFSASLRFPIFPLVPKLRFPSRSQAPAWERTFQKLYFIRRIAAFPIREAKIQGGGIPNPELRNKRQIIPSPKRRGKLSLSPFPPRIGQQSDQANAR